MADTKISALTDGTTPATTDASPWSRSGGTTVKLTWAELKAAMPGAEIGYDQITASATISSTTEATGSTIITCGAHTFDGGPVVASFFAPLVGMATGVGKSTYICLFESSTEIGRLVLAQPGQSQQALIPVFGSIRFTPSAASHTYTVTGFFDTGGGGTVQVIAGAGGAAVHPPAYIRFTKV